MDERVENPKKITFEIAIFGSLKYFGGNEKNGGKSLFEVVKYIVKKSSLKTIYLRPKVTLSQMLVSCKSHF